MGLSGKVTDPKVIAVAEEVIRKTRQTEKLIGISMGYDREAVTHWLELGLQWISLGGDFNLLYAKAKDLLNDVRSIER
jgi:2-keto-3-deoxy-L-rhamnonate aldolase RhmA